MKKLAVLSLVATALFGSINIVADAATTTDLRDQLVSLGVPATGADNLVAYLQTVDLTVADQAEVESLVKQAYDLIGGRTDLTQLSDAEKQQLVGLANKAAAKVGLTVSYSKTTTGNSVVITTTKGETLVTLTSKDVDKVLKNFNGNMESVINSVINSAVEVIGTTTGTSVKPSTGNGLNNTGAELPTVMMAGAGLVVLAAGLMVTSNRKLQD